MTPALSVNVNKVALVRNTRHLGIPSVERAATLCLQAGAHGITVHPRPDGRHIRSEDVYSLAGLMKAWPRAEYNIEGNPFHNLMGVVRDVRPHQCTFVPDSEGQFTSDHGWSFPQDAERLRHRLLELAFRCSSGQQPGLDIAIVGGGATGVELAAELNHTVREMHVYGARLQPAQVHISVIEGAERILAAAPPSLSAYAEEQLAARHVRVLTRSRVAAVTADGVQLQDGSTVAADMTVWAAGVKAPAWLAQLDGLAVNGLNQLQVDAQLRCVADENIVAMGDCAACPGPDGRPLPATAQVAHQQAQWLAGALQAWLQQQAAADFAFKPQGMMVSLGKHTAVGSLAAIVGPKRDYYVEGRGAKLIYASLYRMHQAAVHGWWLAGLLWIGDRLRRVARPALKLH